MNMCKQLMDARPTMTLNGYNNDACSYLHIRKSTYILCKDFSRG